MDRGMYIVRGVLFKLKQVVYCLSSADSGYVEMIGSKVANIFWIECPSSMHDRSSIYPSFVRLLSSFEAAVSINIMIDRQLTMGKMSFRVRLYLSVFAGETPASLRSFSDRQSLL